VFVSKLVWIRLALGRDQKLALVCVCVHGDEGAG
jgi:hypothetical protein